MDAASDDVVRQLRAMGIPADRIEESNVYREQRPDILVGGGDDGILIEVKSKLDFEGFREAQEASYRRGEFFQFVSKLATRSTYGEQVDRAVRQLNDHPLAINALKMVWVNCEGMDPDGQQEVWLNTLFGRAQFIHSRSPSGPSDDEGLMAVIATTVVAESCFHFYESSMWKHRASLHGVILAGGSETVLFVNDLSARADDVLKHEIINRLDMRTVRINDASERYLISSDVPRSDSDAVELELSKKYGLEDVRRVELQRFFISAAYPMP